MREENCLSSSGIHKFHKPKARILCVNRTTFQKTRYKLLPNAKRKKMGKWNVFGNGLYFFSNVVLLTYKLPVSDFINICIPGEQRAFYYRHSRKIIIVYIVIKIFIILFSLAHLFSSYFYNKLCMFCVKWQPLKIKVKI